METKTWKIRLDGGLTEEVKAVTCDIGSKAVVFRKAAGIGQTDGTVVKAFAHGTWENVKLKESK